MILQALCDYYSRKMSDPDPDSRLPPKGFGDKEIPFILEVSAKGKLLGITDTRSPEGKKSRPRSFLVPKEVKRAGGKVAANLLWDKPDYALGLGTVGKPAHVAQRPRAFRERVCSLPEAAQADEGVQAVLCFLDADPLSQAKVDPLFDELATGGAWLAFRLSGDEELVCQRPAVREALSKAASLEAGEDETSVCLVTGEQEPVARTHPAIKGVWGAQSSGGNIVSFNEAAFESYGKKQGDNSPIGETAAFAYTTALNHLLSKQSRQRLQVGDASTVFWAQKSDDLESSFAGFFGEADDPDNTEELRANLSAIQSGKYSGALGDNRFFVLGLAPNNARVSVRFWHTTTLREVANHVVTWFEDIAMDRPPNHPEFPSLFRLLSACAAQGKADNIPPSLGGDIMRATLSGMAFPMSWLSAAVQRSRAEQDVGYYRAAAIKACLNRFNRSAEKQEEFHKMLDTENPNVAYRLGRLFAALEKLQEETHPELNATIRDRYYGAASSTPVTVFTTLLRLQKHHLAKLESKGRVVFFEKLVGEIVDEVPDFPSHLPLPDQARFALGYYQQRQNFFSKSTTKGGHDHVPE